MLGTLDVRRLSRSIASLVPVALAFAALVARPAEATPALTMDVGSGEVLYAQDATQEWFPASTTKLLTVYVALSAVRDHRIAMDTPLVVSARAHAEPPSKMGFPVGTQVTLDNALKMLMVRSANDIAVTVAEGVDGSVEAFADDMNRAAAKLGMRESHFVNPNGLPDPDHYSSARDMATLARALYIEFPEQSQLFNLGSLSLGREIIANHNNLLGRYPGVDGMKTGFTCSAGFNIVASAFRDGRRIVVVVFGAPTVKARSEKVAALFDRAFAGIDHPIGSLASLPATNAGGPPDMRNAVCHARSHLIAEFNAEVTNLDAGLTAPAAAGVGLSGLSPERTFLFSAPPVAARIDPMAPRINSIPQPVFEPVPVHIGAEPGYNGVVAQARAPNTPIGSEPQPVAAMAYAATPPGRPLQGVGDTPLAVDVNALPMRGRRAHTAHARHGRPAMKAATEEPKTKLLAGAEENSEGDAGPKAKHPAKKAVGAGKAKTAKGIATAKTASGTAKKAAAAKGAKKPAKQAAK